MRFDVLDPSLDPFQERFLEASAGTGKTFAIEHLYVRLLLEGENPLRVEQILVVTFTRAATRELKMRIRANIEKALSSLQAARGGFPYLAPFLEKGTRPALERLRAALATADQMQIFTIHSFCYQMLTEFAFDAGTPLELTDPEESPQDLLLEQVVEDFFRTGLSPSAYSPRQIHLLFGRYPGGVHRLKKEVVQLLKRGARISPLPSFREVVEAVQALLDTLPVVARERFLQDYQSLSSCYKQMTDPAYSQQAALLAEILERRSCSPQEVEALIADKTFFLERMGSDNLKQRYQPPSCHYPDLFARLKGELLPLLRKGGDPLLLLLRLAGDCKRKLEESGGVASFDALLERMGESLARPAFLAQVRGRYLAAVIDEFQDTDPLQWKIFETLFVGHARALYLVGDPKQSIYLFRNADIQTYRRARERMGREGRALLTTNFRSQPALVHALNTLFLHREGMLGSLEMEEVVAGREEQAGLEDGKGAVHFFIAEGRVGRQRWPSEQIEEDYLFPFIALEVRRCHTHGSAAVLVKDRYQAERLQAFFKRWGVPSLTLRGSSLVESPAFMALRDLLELVFDPRNPSLLRRVLAGPLFCWTEEQLTGEEAEEEIEQVHRWHRLYRERGVGAMLGTVVEEVPLDVEWAEAFIQLIELLLASDEEPLFFLDALAEREEREEEGVKLRQTEEEGKVLIMTTHVSKGLEFDLVFALGLASRYTPPKERVEKIADRLIKFDPEDPSCQALLQSQEEEKMRQLYVALTRARERVYIPLALSEEGALGNSPSELLMTHLGGEVFAALDQLGARCSLTYERLQKESLSMEALPPPEEVEIPAALPSAFPSSFSGAPCMLTSFSSLAKKRLSRSFPPDQAELPTGAATGNLLHAILEKALFASDRIEEIVEREVWKGPFAPWKEAITQMVRSALTLSWESAGKTIQLSALPSTALFPEVEFLFPYKTDRMKGFIDLLFMHEGAYYLLDWKSNRLPSYDHESLHLAMEENGYFFQASIYAEALRRYFAPLPYQFGGAAYFFLRGPAVYSFLPEFLC